MNTLMSYEQISKLAADAIRAAFKHGLEAAANYGDETDEERMTRRAAAADESNEAQRKLYGALSLRIRD